ncbi:MAG: hypothetical protein WD534_17330 [Phycisphaeraceae bacterium]
MSASSNTPTASATASLIPRGRRLLWAWAREAERWWYDLPGQPGLGCYGTGYAHWGVQTNQKYVAAMAALAASDPATPDASDRQWAIERALAALRFCLATHRSSPGDVHCPDGSRWGQTWISALGLERMMHGVACLSPHLTEADGEAIRRVMVSEADWLLTDYRRGKKPGIQADPWASSDKNDGESNLWNGAFLWRTAERYPDHPHADAWRDRGHAFLVNGVSIAADAVSETVYDGRKVRDLHVGANFFPHYAFDHHGYFNVGYMAICASNAAILHFDLKAAGLASPDALHHHQADLWQVLRRLIFSDGRLARVGGDSRVRYGYCQEFLLPTLLYAADHLRDAQAMQLADRQLALIETEAATNDDGSFYGRRLDWLRHSSLYYYLRLESDRASALGMLLHDLPLLETNVEQARDVGDHEASVAGGWAEPTYGAVFHRTVTRLASFTWRAHGLAQGMCQPPDDGALAEWSNNLAGGVWFEGGDGRMPGDAGHHRRLLRHHLESFEGGFVTCGAIMEGVNLRIPDGWTGTDRAVHQIAFAALPDGHTVVGLQYCRMLEHRHCVTAIKGLHLNLPNDLLNGNARTLHTPAGPVRLTAPPAQDECLDLGHAWLVVDERVGVVGLYGGAGIVIDRSRDRRGGPYRSLFVDQICWPHQVGARPVESGAVVLDAGWAVLASAGVDETAHAAQHSRALPRASAGEAVRGVVVRGQDGRVYHVLANFSDEPADVPAAGRQVQLKPSQAVVI